MFCDRVHDTNFRDWILLVRQSITVRDKDRDGNFKALVLLIMRLIIVHGWNHDWNFIESHAYGNQAANHGL